jgi:hypothetical protein
MKSELEDPFAEQARQRTNLAVALATIPGGRSLLEWFGDVVDFGDSEVVRVVLDRQGLSQLVIALDWPEKSAVVTFDLSEWIDVDLRGFSHQNVIGGLVLEHAADRDVDPWEKGVGLVPGDWIIRLAPCFGAAGTIRANIKKITIV